MKPGEETEGLQPGPGETADGGRVAGRRGGDRRAGEITVGHWQDRTVAAFRMLMVMVEIGFSLSKRNQLGLHPAIRYPASMPQVFPQHLFGT